EMVDSSIVENGFYTFSHLIRARILVALGRYDEALRAINFAIELNPIDSMPYANDAVAFAVRGQIYEFLGENDLATEDYTAAIALDPENVIVQAILNPPAEIAPAQEQV
ncbi:MAG TPA: hypothetical protein PLZ51_17515, partial [Aggregatilineales bacterium]|nr:hypothetical protein [Aggregatilineales bacterium]